MPQQVPISAATHQSSLPATSSSSKQQVVDAQHQLSSASEQQATSATSNENSAPILGNHALVAAQQYQQQQQQTSVNSNGINTNNNNGTTTISTNTSNNLQTKRSHENPKPTIKLNGLKNRIIQRPPPLILDKVSNFYDNESNSYNALPQQPQLPPLPPQNQQASTVIRSSSSTNSSTITTATNHSNCNTNNQSTAKSNASLPALNSKSSEAASNNQSNNNHSGANHKFWASLNENASRTKALVSARNVSATETATHIQATSSAKSTKDVADSGDFNLGADLVISHRNSSGAVSTSCVVSSLTTRKPLVQQHDSHTEAIDLRQEINEPELQPPVPQQIEQSTNDTGNYHSTHNVSNLSNDNDDVHVLHENGGGNLIGVDNPTPPAAERTGDTPASATSSRPRSNNPFLDIDDDLHDGSKAQQSNFHKRPASFIAATDKFANSNRSLNLASSIEQQQIVEEQFNELYLNGNAQNHPHTFQPNTTYQNETIFIERGAVQVDHRDSQPSYMMTGTQHDLPTRNFQNQHKSQPSNMATSQPIYGTHTGRQHHEPSISIDSESASCQPPPSAMMQLPHWTDAIYELNNAILETSSIAGGAENGQFIYIIENGDIILELDRIKVSGFTLVEFNDLVESKQFHLLNAVQTKHSHGLINNLKQYLDLSFPKKSLDKQLQNQIRENIYRRTIPCTTRPPKKGEVDRIDYHFLTKDQFMEMDSRGMLLESGVYAGHYYGTMKPFCDVNSLSTHQAIGNQNGNFGKVRQAWDADHPIVGVVNRSDGTVSDVSLGDNPLYENHESLKLHQQMHTPQTTLRAHDLSSANQNGLIASESVCLPPPVSQSSIVAVDSEELPPGWERVIDQTHGTYYIDHNTQRTQYERPYEIELTKGAVGFGFTLVEADSGLLFVRSVIPGGPAYLNGMIRPGDILISAVGVSVAGLQHTDIARLFSTFAVGDRVRLTFARSTYVVDDNLIPDEYLFSNGTIGDLAIAVNPNSEYNNHYNQKMGFASNPHIFVDQDFEFITVVLKRGDQGFGFTISDSVAGQKVRKIQNNEICSNLKQNDILTSLNGEDITKLTHKEVVERLKKYPVGHDVTLIVKRKKRFRSKTPMAMPSDTNDEYSLDSTPQRNCKTPSLDGIMLRRPVTHKSNDPMVSRTLFANHPRPQSMHDPGYMPDVTSELPIPHTQFNQNLSEIYGTLPPQLVAPQPIYESNPMIGQQQDLYYSHDQHSLPPLATKPNNISEQYDLSQQNGPASMPSSGLMCRNMTNSIHPSETSSISNMKQNISKATSLTQANQFNNFMHNDKLVMMQMQQQQQQQQNYQQLLPHVINQGVSDYHHVPLYSNGELLRTAVQPPALAPKPLISQGMSEFFGNNNSHNYYANNEEIAMQQVQFNEAHAKVNQLAPNNNPFGTMQSIAHYGQPQTPLAEPDEYEYHQVDLDRENTDSNWGIRLIGGAEVERAISIGSIVFGGAASKNGKLRSGDEIISINDINVVGATHQHVVELISACTNRASLVVRRKKFAEACDVVLTRNMDEGFGFVIISSGNCALIGRIIDGSPADRCQQLHVRDRIIAVNGRYITPRMQHPEIVNMIKECGSELRLRIIPADSYTVELIKSAQNDNFGFSMRGGSEYNGMPLYILRVAPDGLARDLLNVGDQIIGINNIPTVGMTHQQAASIIKFGDWSSVKLKLRRNHVTPPSLLVDSPRALQKFNQVTAEMKTVNASATPNDFVTHDAASMSSEQVGSSQIVSVGANTAIKSHQQQHSGSGLEQVDQQTSSLNHSSQTMPLYAT